MSKNYILDGHKPIPVDLMTWAKWFEKADCQVAASGKKGKLFVSTVFLGLDHSFGGGSPMLFADYEKLAAACTCGAVWDYPSDPINTAMMGTVKQFEISDDIVGPVTVEMVDSFGWTQPSAKTLLGLVGNEVPHARHVASISMCSVYTINHCSLKQ